MVKSNYDATLKSNHRDRELFPSHDLFFRIQLVNNNWSLNTKLVSQELDQDAHAV
jgi:hypothetical protein